jgi:transcriptional regulator GlxA family with amidase domain
MMEEAVGNAGTISVNAIASASGFNSHTTFYRIFRQSTGLTPREYLIQLKKDKKKEHPFVS